MGSGECWKLPDSNSQHQNPELASPMVLTPLCTAKLHRQLDRPQLNTEVPVINSLSDEFIIMDV